jgi:tetratricopeptide (TPR) repeat protein
MEFLFLAATLAAPNPARKEPPTAEGLMVLLRPSDAPPLAIRPDPGLTPATPLTGTEFAVLKEESGRVLLRNKGTDVWVSRSLVMTPKEAIAFFSERINSEAIVNNYVRRAKAHELDFNWDAAIKDYDEALKLSPQSSAYWNNRANYYSRKREHQKALDGYDEAVRISPTSFIPLGNRANVFLNLREWDKAIEAYERAMRVNPNYARSYAGRSTAWREKREFEKALADAGRSVELDSASPHTFNARGMCWTAMKDYDNALADFDEALRFDPLFAAAYFGRAGVYLSRKQYQLAMADLDKAMRLSPRYAAAMARRAEVWIACGNPRKALSDLEEAIAADDRYPLAYRQKAWLLATSSDDALRDGKRALEAARKAEELAKDARGETWEVIAAALAETGDFTGAGEFQKKAIADAGYAKEKGDGVQKRLESYEAKKPYRE